MKRLNEHIKSSVSIYEDFLNLCPTIDGVQLAENIMKLHHRSLRPCLLYNNQQCWAGLLHSITLTIKTTGCMESCWFWVIEKPTCSHLHDCCGVILAYLQHTTGFLSLQYINDHLLGAFYFVWRQRYDCYECVSYKVSWNESRIIDIKLYVGV
jgi:hypothetical protein